MSDAAYAAVTPDRIYQFAFGYAPTLILEAATRNQVFDVLDAGPMTIDEVSAETGASTRGLRAIMNALVGLDFLAKDGERYSLTPESAAFLVSTKPSFQGGILRHTSEQLLPKWLSITDVVRTGEPSIAVNAQEEGAEFFVELVKDIFPMSYRGAQALAEALGLESASTPVRVLDIAAGSGVWGIALAQKSPQVTVSAVDWPLVLAVTEQYATRFGLTDRFRYISGDLRTVDFGEGYDIATLGHILHSEGAEWSKALIGKVFDSLAPCGQIVIAEMVPNEDRKGPAFPLIFAVNMLINTDEGDTFTFKEISAWLTDAGFRDVRTLDAPGPSPLILATKPG